MNKHISIILKRYYNKNKRLPPYGRSLTEKDILKKGDIADYMLEVKAGYVYVRYTYYSNCRDETKYVTDSYKLCKA